MKKLKLLLSALLIVVFAGFFNTASALQFTNFDLNLNTIQAGYGVYEDIFLVTVEGFAEVTQSFGPDFTFGIGDPFVEMAIFQKVSYKKAIGGSTQFFSGLMDEDKYMYIYAEGITGVVTDVGPGTFPDVAFEYAFDFGSGDIGVYIGDDDGVNLVHNAGTAQTVGKFNLIAGEGDGLDTFLPGISESGTTRLTASFDQALTPNNVWSALGLDLGNLPSGYEAFGFINTTNFVEILDGFSPGENAEYPLTAGFTSTINSSGQLRVAVVPEPTTMLLFGVGLLGLAGVSRKRYSK